MRRRGFLGLVAGLLGLGPKALATAGPLSIPDGTIIDVSPAGKMTADVVYGLPMSPEYLHDYAARLGYELALRREKRVLDLLLGRDPQ